MDDAKNIGKIMEGFVNLRMETIELDLDKNDGLESFSSKLKDLKINIGRDPFQLKIHFSNNLSPMLYAGFLFLLDRYLEEAMGNTKNDQVREPESAYLEYDQFRLFFKDFDLKKLESNIAAEYKIDIEWKQKSRLDDVFGIWKGKDITLEKIREKAWRRTK